LCRYRNVWSVILYTLMNDIRVVILSIAKAFWNEFCEEHKVLTNSVELFESVDLFPTVFAYGKNGRMILKRSNAMDNKIKTEVAKVIADYNEGTNRYEGLIYIMFWKQAGQVVPLYIGKSEKLGRRQNLSENISNIMNDNGKFCRWGYNYRYHIGNLSAVVCIGHPETERKNNAIKWAKTLFKRFPEKSPELNQRVFFWIQAWEHGTVGPWKEFGATSLTFQEYLLIGLASEAYPEVVLNSEGVNRK
jgi:hypothetical protein